MKANRRNLVFKVSIVINVAVLLYGALHLSGTSGPGVVWVPVTVDGSERTSELRYMNIDDLRNQTDGRYEPSLRNFIESTSQKTPFTATTNKTTSSTISILELEKKIEKGLMSVEQDVTREIEIDQNNLTDGTLVRLRELLGCSEKDYYFQVKQRGEFWVLKNYVRADHGIVQCHETITYSTHAGFEFLDNVQPLVERWMAPISIAIYAPGADMTPTVNSIRYLRDCLGNDLVRQFVTFHVFFSNKHIPSSIPNADEFLATPYNCSLPVPYKVNSSSTYKKQKSLLYPVNVARNVARDAALTHFILPSDIELYPSPNLVPQFLNMIARNAPPLDNTSRPRVFPITLFEIDEKYTVPTTKTQLQAMLKNKTAIPFHKFVCPNCHNIPQAQQWMSAPETGQMNVFHVGKRRGKFVHWEPIFIGTNREPYYDERLSWEGKKDKMPQGYILCVKDYDFMILNNAFLIHKPGIKHYQRNKQRDTFTTKQNHFVTKVVVPELKRLYGSRTGCQI